MQSGEDGTRTAYMIHVESFNLIIIIIIIK